MPVNIEEKIKKLSPERRKKVEARAKELIAEEMTLRELRKAHNLTQERLAKVLKIGQEQVSRLEQRMLVFYCTTLLRELDVENQRSTIVERWFPTSTSSPKL